MYIHMHIYKKSLYMYAREIIYGFFKKAIYMCIYRESKRKRLLKNEVQRLLSLKKIKIKFKLKNKKTKNKDDVADGLVGRAFLSQS